MPWQPTNNVEQDRWNKLQALVENGIDPYPKRVERTHRVQEAIQAFVDAETANPDAPTTPSLTICGRIVRQNLKGKIYFAHIFDESGRVQLFVRFDTVGEATFDLIKQALDMGDFVQATGTMMRTKAGEISVEVHELKLLAKALSPLPVIKERQLEDGTIERYGEFSDVEERYRQRYADLAVNPEVREVFRKRSRVIRAVQNFLDNEGFLEVETPILQPIYGGAAARPFVTHHNQLHQDLFLRISFELYLKRLLIGGYDGVYEIGRDFRNEGVSFKHNPEFTMLEFYKAFIDYRGAMDITERMMATVVQELTGSMVLEYQEHTIDFTPPWRRITIHELVQQELGIDYKQFPTAEMLEAEMLRHGIRTKPGLNWGKLVEELLSQVETRLIQPTFVMDYPIEISPFAKRTDNDPHHVERYEIYIAGMELGNAFTELNNPLQQEENFINMSELYRGEDEDVAPIDEDYLNAMRYGMPPCGGVGVGIDRLVMLVTNRATIREVLLFPHLRTKE